MCAYCQCLLPLLPYYLVTLPNVCLLSMLITIITYYLVTLANVSLTVNAYYRYYTITLLLYLMCAYCQCLLPLLPITLLL